MWWDILPFFGQPEKPEHAKLDHEILSVMERTLNINHVVCQESSLHGLGHWAAAYPVDVSRIVDDFLSRNRSLRSELKQYAIVAKPGKVQESVNR